MGSIERTPAGTWKARYRDPQGGAGAGTSPRKTDAKLFLAAVEVDTRRGEWVDPASGRMTIAEWVEE